MDVVAETIAAEMIADAVALPTVLLAVDVLPTAPPAVEVIAKEETSAVEDMDVDVLLLPPLTALDVIDKIPTSAAETTTERSAATMATPAVTTIEMIATATMTVPVRTAAVTTTKAIFLTKSQVSSACC